MKYPTSDPVDILRDELDQAATDGRWDDYEMISIELEELEDYMLTDP